MAILALSGIVFLTPLAAPVFATNPAAPSITLTPNVLGDSASGYLVSASISNPSTNTYAITAFTITAPTGWKFSGTPIVGVYFTCTASGTSLACSLKTGVSGLPPGAADSNIAGATLIPPTVTSFPVKATFTTSVQDASSAAYYSGPTFYTYIVDSLGTVAVTLSPTSTTFTAGGSPYTVTVTVLDSSSNPQGGLPIAWTVGGAGAGTISPASGTTTASGTATATFTPTNSATAGKNVNFVVATLGTDTAQVNPATTGAFSGSSALVTTVAGAPASVLMTFLATGGAVATSPAFPMQHYETRNNATAAALGMTEIPGTDLYFSVADAFGNPVTSGLSGITGTLTAAGGFWCLTSAPANTCLGSVQETVAVASGNIGTGAGLGYNYWQSGQYGWAGEITISLSGTYNPGTGGISFGPIRTPTNKISTATFAGAAAHTGITFNDVTDGLHAPTIAAGSTYSPRAIINPLQQGVPLTIQVCTTCASTTTGYTGTFSATKAAEFGGVTNSSGELGAVFAVDTLAGTVVQLNATWTQQTDSGSVAYTNGPSTAVKTVAGPSAEFVIQVGFGSKVAPITAYAVEGATVSVAVSLSDAYGNPTLAPASSPEIQIALTATGGLLSATSVYIPANDAATNSTGAFGAIYWSLPSALAKYTLSASGVVNGAQVLGSKSVTTVSPTPTFSVTAPTIPTAGIIYSNSPTVVFSGQANISIGYPPNSADAIAAGTTPVTIKSVDYKLGTGASGKATVIESSTPGAYTWNAVAFLAAGLNTVTFNATDSNTSPNTYTSQTYQVLVDSSAPTVTFTTANNAVLSNGAVATATIVVGEGDLNATSVVATVNGTALPASDVSVSGTNNPGTSVTYTVSIALPVGSDYVGLSASSLAGLTGTATPITVTESLPIDMTFSASGSGLPTFTTQSGFSGISVTWKNNDDPAALTAQFWIQFTGPTTSAEFQGSTVAAGGSTTVFYGTSGLAPGSYTATVYVSVGIVPYSPSYSVTFTVT